MIELLLSYLVSKYTPLIFFTVFIASLYLQRWQTRRSASALGALAPDVGIKGPLGIGFFTEAIRTWKNNTSLEFWEWIFENNGTAARGSYTSEVSVMGGNRFIITADPENIKAALATQFGEWGKGQMLYDAFKPFLGNGILSTDGEQWHRARHAMRPLFMRERVGDLDLFERNVQRLIPRLGNGSLVEVEDLIFRYTLDAISEFLLGSRVGSLEDESNRFTEAFSEVQRVQSVIMRAGPLAWAIPRRSYMANIKILDTYIEPFISQGLALPFGGDDSKADTLLHALTAYTRDRKIIRDQLTSVLFAGSDTTASALSWVFFELARNPQVVAKLRSLILQTIGSERQPTYQEIKDLKYLTHVINETLRLYATMPFATRQALVDTTLPRGGGPDGLSPVGVKAGTPILYSALLMHRRRDLYPPYSEKFPYDPLQWVPERWETWTPKSWQLIPFSGGPRICIGQQFAVMEIAYTICRVLQIFEKIVDYNDAGPPVLKYGIVVSPFNGVKLGFLRENVPVGL